VKGRARRRDGRSGTAGAMRVGFAWYTQEEWTELRATADDVDALDDNYASWLASAESALAELRSRGIEVAPFHVTVAKARQWAHERGMRFDSAARSAYVTDAMREGASG
jgi:hypothetical protein